jgi:hypothetical protein
MLTKLSAKYFLSLSDRFWQLFGFCSAALSEVGSSTASTTYYG